MEKSKYELLKGIKARINKGEKTTFAERNLLNMEEKKKRKKARENAKDQNKH